ncbi:MAG: HD domain-containing protein [Acidobacteria bacterium]|nr:HD domain-containing protein [Acidobacteriota bacterium]MBI3278741.1 HD domain-containing protein [Acidobacteriota bacterium]
MFSARFDRALALAHELHRKQKRKTSGVPYVAHLLGVCALVIEDGGSEDEAIAALLHDAIEDQSTYQGGRARLAARIEREFGGEVRRLVEALTETSGPGEHGIRDVRERWRAHKRGYIEQILSADAAVRRVSCADSIHNVRALIRDHRRSGDAIWERFRTRSRDDQLWGYAIVARAFMEAGGGPLAEELRHAVEELWRECGVDTALHPDELVAAAKPR